LLAIQNIYPGRRKMANTDTAYPVKLTIDYPDRPLNKLSTFFRLFAAIPIFIILGLLPGMYFIANSHGHPEYYRFGSSAFVFFPLVLMILFQQKYPRWWFDWNLSLVKFVVRVKAYLLLLRDEYPSTDEEQAIHIDIQYPNAQTDLNRWLPLIKWFLAIPHFVVLAFLAIAVVICVIIAWFAILFTGRYPRSLFDFIVGVFRWGLRVCSYAILLVTDKYPPFSLAE
jgi:hypothetical protein